MKIEELMSHLEEIKQQESNPVWLKKLMYTIEENNVLILPAISTIPFFRI